MSDYLKPGSDENDPNFIASDIWDFDEWFDNDPDGWVVAVFEEAMMGLAETTCTELAVIYILSSYQLTNSSRLKQTWLKMFDWWSENLDEQSKQQLHIYYDIWVEGQE
jgi:hypothetical protein